MREIPNPIIYGLYRGGILRWFLVKSMEGVMRQAVNVEPVELLLRMGDSPCPPGSEAESQEYAAGLFKAAASGSMFRLAILAEWLRVAESSSAVEIARRDMKLEINQVLQRDGFFCGDLVSRICRFASQFFGGSPNCFNTSWFFRSYTIA